MRLRAGAMMMAGVLLGAAAHAQTPSPPPGGPAPAPCSATIVAHYPSLSGGDRTVLAGVLADDGAAAATTQGSALAGLYAALSADGFMQAAPEALPAPLVAFEWAPGGRAQCAAFDQRAVPTPAPAAGPDVILQTNMGDITITLDPARAPKTAANFLRYVKAGHYAGAAIYRIEPGYVIQLGDYDAQMKYRRPKFPPIALETATNKHARGAVAMARGDDPNSAQSTFYFDLADNSGLNAKADAPANTTGYAVFAVVSAGMDVLDKIAGVELSPAGGPFPGKAPKTAIVVRKAMVVP